MQRLARLTSVTAVATALTLGATSPVAVLAAAESAPASTATPDSALAPDAPAVAVDGPVASQGGLEIGNDSARSLLRALRSVPGRDFVEAETLVEPPAPAPEAQVPSAPTPAPAQAAPVPSEPHHAVVGRDALARLRRVDLAAIGWRVVFHPGRDGYLGMADQHRRVIDVYVRDHHTVDQVLATLAHEAAHALDYEVWTDDVRRQWMRMRGITTSWWPSCECEDRGFGAGDIAEAVAVLEVGRGVWAGHLAPPTDAQLRWLADLLA